MSNLRTYRGIAPTLGARVYVDPAATVIGAVELADDASVWPGAVLRGDVHHIRIGARSNVQDNGTIHVATGRHPTLVGEDVTIGHNVVLHGCTVGNRALIGIGAIVLDRCIIGDDCMIAAGSLLTPGTAIPAGHLALGSPAKVARPLTDGERAHIVQSAHNYVANAARYRAQGI